MNTTYQYLLRHIAAAKWEALKIWDGLNNDEKKNWQYANDGIVAFKNKFVGKDCRQSDEIWITLTSYGYYRQNGVPIDVPDGDKYTYYDYSYCIYGDSENGNMFPTSPTDWHEMGGGNAPDKGDFPDSPCLSVPRCPCRTNL